MGAPAAEAGRVSGVRSWSSGTLGAHTGGGQVCVQLQSKENKGALDIWVLEPGGLAPSCSLCLSFQIREMGTGLESVEITGHPGRGCKGLSGQP